jgi:ribosomal protein L22
MADETPEKPKRRRARRKPSEEASASEAPRAVHGDEEATASGASASDADASSEAPVADDVTPSDEDLEAEQATEVVLEADDEAEGEAEDADASEEEEPVAAETVSEDAEEADTAAEEPSAPPAARPARRRSRERPVGPPPVVRAQAKYVRSSARKARLVCDHIRGKSVEEARAILATAPRAIARDWSKLLESAVANAEHNHELVGEDLYVKAVHADEGPTIKRFRPRAMGRATRIRKRTSHLTILLTPKD